MKRTLVLLIVSLCVSLTYASWQNPVLLTELNDYVGWYGANWPTISSDGQVLLFTRSTPTKVDALWEANRSPDTGLFDQQRQLSELKNGGAQVYGTWLSTDKLRLYYATHDLPTVGWRRPVWVATRNNPTAQWQQYRRFSELEVDQYLNSCTLTSDELNIMWMSSAINGGGIYGKIYTASRPSILHNFSNVKEALEFAGMQPKAPSMSPDGLKVYFLLEDSQKLVTPWVGFRKTISMPFGDFQLIKSIADLGPVWTNLSQSWNGKELYYFQLQRADCAGIFVSQWVDDSFEDAIANMHRAINKKERAIELLQQAAQEEQIARNLLTTLPQEAFPAQLAAKDLNAAVRKLEHAMAKQDQITSILGLCLDNLRLSLEILPPLPPLPPVPPQQ